MVSVTAMVNAINDDVVLITGTLTTDSIPLGGKTINFYYSYDGSTWSLIGSQVTNNSGQASVTHQTDKTTYYKVEFNGDPYYEPSSATATYTPAAPQAPAPTGIPIWFILLILLVVLGILTVSEQRR